MYTIKFITMHRSFGVLVWEVATYGEPPHDNLQTRDVIEMAGNGTLKLDR